MLHFFGKYEVINGVYTPQFLISNKILKNIGIIEASKEVIDHAPLLPYYERQFREDALIRTVHYGTHIEGNELNLTQAEKVLAGQDVVARERDIQEVINYRKTMDFINDKGLMINDELIKKLHRITINKILPPEKCGEYRKTQVVIKNNQTGQVSFRPPEADLVAEQVKDLLAFISAKQNQDIHPVLESGIVHYELVRIHPFTDGNGRVARALSTLILFMQGYDIRKFFSLEEYFDRNASNYYTALQSVAKENGDLTKWLEYFTEGLAIELSKIKEKVEKISVDGKLREKLGGKPLLLSDRQLRIIEYIQKTGFLQNQAFEELFPMVSEDTILNELKVLVKNGIIKKQGVTKGAKYIMK
ncbi:MAG: Fic family protein [Candidatus Levybacteria bacterium]|nr:Fic family protein [Candidatus Levybacteria bacterium]